MLLPLAHGRSPHLPVRPSSARRPPADPRQAQGLAAAVSGGTALAARRRDGRKALHQAGQVLSTGRLLVDGYELYYEEHGCPTGLCVVFLHGGPGAGSSRRMAQLFDPTKYRIILFDQRGCGKSLRQNTQLAEEQLEENTTWHHVRDLERLREHLKIEKWVVAGGSWGTCLALAYATRCKERVLAMVLRAVPRRMKRLYGIGIGFKTLKKTLDAGRKPMLKPIRSLFHELREVFLFRPAELDFFCGPTGGAKRLAPGAYETFASWLDATSARDVARGFRRAALGQDGPLGRRFQRAKAVLDGA